MKKTILDYLENTVEKMPDQIAVIDEKGSFSWIELFDKSKRIGSFLLDKITMTEPVAVFADKHAWTLATFLGIVQAGGFYVFINPELPPYRIIQIQSVLEAKYWITDEEHMEKAGEYVSQEQLILMSDAIKTDINESGLLRINDAMVDTNPLYANFTSGSTGVPKGVLVSHRSVLDFIDVFTEEFQIDASDRIGNQAPFDFDVSVKDIYSCLNTGATLVIIPRRLFSSPMELLDYICEHRVTTMIWAVSAVCLISTLHGLDYKTPKDIKRVLFSGEEMPLKHLRDWMQHLPDAEFVNLYGPTEITCNCTYYRIQKHMDYTGGIPIGTAFSNETVFLLDENHQLITKPNQRGEICVRGSALALGYYNNPEQTSKAFCQNPLQTKYPERIYRTGDLAYYVDDKNLMFAGRKDFQIKYMGHRIELEEVERMIASIKEVERVCVVYEKEKHKMYGFYIGKIDKRDLHIKLKEFLPIYMIPNMLLQVEEFPLTKNGKVDRNALMEKRKKK